MALFISALIIGVFLGTIYGLMAFGMVASYRISRVINLGQAGIAALGATVFFSMTSDWGLPMIVSLVAAILAGVVVGGGLGYANLLMSEWPKGFVMIFTLCVTLMLFALVDRMLPARPVSPMSPFGTGGFNSRSPRRRPPDRHVRGDHRGGGGGDGGDPPHSFWSVRTGDLR